MAQYAFTMLSKKYGLMETIGNGGFAKVKLAVHLLSGEKVAIKIMEKLKLGHDLPRVYREIEALRSFDHPGICKLFEIIETQTHIFLVLEYCSGGELFDYIVDRDRVNEIQGRKFFRQIVAAISYVHGMGYAHRDLKPENLLLDAHLNLKLIDFGLCAKPKGGMLDQLRTCCGSPAYAAPELISGRAYRGSEADIWSMGVLLYALLCGSLPFDDQNINNLYKKITRGQYKMHNWLSPASKNIITRMLQVDPSQRITLSELESHPWLATKLQRPKPLPSSRTRTRLDHDCLNTMVGLLGKTASQIATEVLSWKFDETTALYMLLRQRKHNAVNWETLPKFESMTPVSPVTPAIHVSLTGGLDNSDVLILYEDIRSTSNHPKSSTKRANTAMTADNQEQQIKRDRKECATPKRKLNINAFAQPRLPTQRKNHRPCPGTSVSEAAKNNIEHSKLTSAGSVDAGAQALTPVRSTWSSQEGVASGSGTPMSARRVLGSFERGLNRVRNILTPKRRLKIEDEPAVLPSKGLCNVSTTACTNADFVLSELRRTLHAKGIDCQQRGYILIGKIRDHFGKAQLSFELEVCLVGPTKMVGVRRKRIRGDAWGYKRICEEILALAALQQPLDDIGTKPTDTLITTPSDALSPTPPDALSPTPPDALSPTPPDALSPTPPDALSPTTPDALSPTTPDALSPTTPDALSTPPSDTLTIICATATTITLTTTPTFVITMPTRNTEI